MLKKFWQKFCSFWGGFIELFEVVNYILAVFDILGGLPQPIGFFVIFCFVLVALAPIFGLIWLYDWLCSLF